MVQQFTGLNGQINIYERGMAYPAELGSTTHYLEVLFCEMDFTGPSSRARTEETLIMNRGTFDTDSHYNEGPQDPRYAPYPISFSARLADTVDTRALSDLLSAASAGIVPAGSTVGARIPLNNAAGGTTYFVTFDGSTTIDGNDLAAFADSSKMSYRVEMFWDGPGSDLGYRYEEVYFTPGEQTITESPDGLMLSINGQCYGDVTRITAFQSGTSIIAFS